MLPLYLRGLGLGLIFTPLTTIALLDIPKPQLAQASGLYNTVRQIGGSFGIAVLGTILSRRVIFHTQMYGEQIKASSPAFQEVMKGLKDYSLHTAGVAPHTAALQAKLLLFKNVAAQAFVQGISDDFFIGAVLTAVLVIPLFMLKTKNRIANAKNANR